jgi:hypothetical protein
MLDARAGRLDSVPPSSVAAGMALVRDDDAMDSNHQPEIERRAGPTLDRMVGAIVGGTMGNLVALHTGAPESAVTVAGFVGPIGEEASYWLRQLVTRRQDNADRMLSRAMAQSACTEEEFLSRATTDSTRTELFVRAIEAAARSTTDRKLDLLAGILRDGVLASETAYVDELLVALAAASEMDFMHLRLIEVLRKPTPQVWESDELQQELKYAWSESHIGNYDPGLARVLPALLGRLQSLGLITDLGVGRLSYEPLWGLNSFGQLCVAALENYSEGQQ